MDEKYYEVEGAVFREVAGKPIEVYIEKTGKWAPYKGDAARVYRLSNPMTLDEVKPYMGTPAEASEAE